MNNQSSSLLWKSISFILFIILIIALAGAGFWLFVENNKSISTVNVQGLAKIKAVPTTATINLYIEESNPDTIIIDQNLDQKEKDILDFLQSEGVKLTSIKTNRDVYQSYDVVPSPEEEIETNEGTLSIQITFEDINDDLQRPREIVQESVKRGVTRYDQFYFDFGDISDICQDLENEAIKNALEKAEDRIDALGGGKIQNKEIISVQGCQQDNYYYSRELYAQDTASKENVELNLNPGEQELQAFADMRIEFK